MVPTIVDDSLAPPGKQVLSLNVGNAPYRLRECTWEQQRDVFAKRTIAKLAEYMPILPDLIRGVETAARTAGSVGQGRLCGPRSRL